MACYPGPPLYPSFLESDSKVLPPIPSCEQFKNVSKTLVDETFDMVEQVVDVPTATNMFALGDFIKTQKTRLQSLLDVLPSSGFWRKIAKRPEHVRFG
ncbi:unnamed protein product [Caenorhabditis auriculariae]|uniref:Uncharacterized protein n=1 Tax=Caenorhabditis auriculariae TaxID=2777116 RepID=A0A8S1GT12_9PELO|nr:unnamed protein product [Caenorhabditis auriculariae]